MRLAKELTPSSPILRNQTFSPNCAIGFLHLRPVLLISLVFPSLPVLILFMTCAAKRGSQPSNGLSSAMRTPVFCSAEIWRVLHGCFAPLTAISVRPLAMWSSSGGPCGVTSTPARAWITTSWGDFVVGSLSHFKMILRKPGSLMKPTRNEMECWPINQNWKRVCVFLCQKTVIESYDRSRPFSFLFFQQFNSMLSTNTATFDTSSTPTPVDSMSGIFMFLFLSARWILRIHSDSGNFCFQKFLIFFVSHFDICTRFQLVRCHHLLVLHLDSEFSLDLRAHCSAIPVSRLLTVLRKTMIGIVHIVVLCRFHFSVQVEIENVVFEVDRNEVVLAMPIHQFSFLDKFCCRSESCIHRYVRGRNLVVLCTRFLPHCTELCVLQWVFHSEIWAIRFRRIVGTAKLHHQESIHHWQSDRIFHLLLFLDENSMGMCWLQLLCPGSSSPIQTASDYRWHWHPNLQVKMSLRKCHTFVHHLRAIQQNSSHQSIHRNSSHRSIRHHSNHRSRKCQWDMSVQIPELPSLSPISSFQGMRDQLSMFCRSVRLWHLGSFGFSFRFSLDFFTLAFALTLGPCMTCSFCLCQRLLACALACIAVSLKMCSTALETPITRTRWPFSFARREGVDCINIHGTWVSTGTAVTRLGITNSQWPKSRLLDLIVQLVLHLLLVARRVALPPFDTRLKFQNRASSRRNDRAQKVSFASSCRRIVSLLMPPMYSSSWRQCHSPRNTWERWVLCASAAAQTPGFALLCPRSCPSAWTRDQLLSSWFPSAVQRPTPTSSQTSLITPAKNASVFFDHYWKSSSRPVNSLGRPRPFTSMRLGVSFRTWAVARLLTARTASASQDSAATCARRLNTSCWSWVTSCSMVIDTAWALNVNNSCWSCVTTCSIVIDIDTRQNFWDSSNKRLQQLGRSTRSGEFQVTPDATWNSQQLLLLRFTARRLDKPPLSSKQGSP